MPKAQASSEPTIQEKAKGCGCGDHSEHVQAEKSPTGVLEQQGPSTHNKQVQIKHSTDHSGCCCGDKTAG